MLGNCVITPHFKSLVIWWLILTKCNCLICASHVLTGSKNLTHLLRIHGRVSRNEWHNEYLLVLSFLLQWVHETQCVSDHSHFHLFINQAGDIFKHAWRKLEWVRILCYRRIVLWCQAAISVPSSN